MEWKMQHYRPKVFFIGLNKTATTSFHKLFLSNGYKSFHHSTRINRKKIYLGETIKHNLEENKKLLSGLEDYDVYSEFCFATDKIFYEGSENFNILDKQYPNSYFILQTRNEKDWINSRFNHKSVNAEDFYLRAQKALNLDEPGLKNYWLENRKTLHKKIRHYFENRNNFIEYNIDKENIEKVTTFLKNYYDIDIKFWKKHNATT